MSRVLAIPALLGLLALTVLTAAPASADTTSFHDERGDAVARYDLTRVSVTNETDRIVVISRVRDLRGDRTQIFGISIMPTISRDTYMAKTVRWKDGTVTAKLSGFSADGAPITTPCEVTARWKPAKDTVRVSFARGCIAVTGAVRVQALIGAGNGSSGDPSDWTKWVRVSEN